MKLPSQHRGMTLVETMVATVLVGVLGLVVYSLLNIGTILGAKNTAVNTAHQQARTAMLQMVQDLHASVSLPALADVNGDPLPTPTPGTTPAPAPGIAFQLMTIGPLKIAHNHDIGDDEICVIVPNGVTKPAKGQRIIVRSHGIEEEIKNVSTSGNVVTLKLYNDLTVDIDGVESPTNYNIPCIITDRCSYAVVNQTLTWKGPTTKKTFAVLGSNITNPTPFNTPTTPAGSPFHRFVAAIDLSTADPTYSNRGFKSANILLNGMVPMRARLTDKQ